MARSSLKAPFPWFGGKRHVAPQVWEALGDVASYVEPFAGSLAVLLGRPAWHRGFTETVNDADDYLTNFWRSIQADPEAVAHYADWPVNETDINTRHRWLVAEGQQQMQNGLKTDPEWYDAKIAGWWVWGLCNWIGGGWCSLDSTPSMRKRPHLNSNQGINREQRPHLNSNQGINRLNQPSLGSDHLPSLGGPRGVGTMLPSKFPSLASQGINRKKLPSLGAFRGIERPTNGPLLEYFEMLAERLRRVRICSGDWQRVLTDGALAHGSSVGVFLDPPYGDVRTHNVYARDSLTVAGEVAQWCRDHENDKRIRIVLCGYEGEHDMPGWRVIEWKAAAAYQTTNSAKTKKGGNQDNRHKERLWLSPSIGEAGFIQSVYRAESELELELEDEEALLEEEEEEELELVE